MQKRNDYLKSLWKPYPAVEVDNTTDLYGRIIEIADKFVLIERNFQITKYSFENLKFESQKILKILVQGDIISIINHQILLLVPNQISSNLSGSKVNNENVGSKKNNLPNLTKINILKKWSQFLNDVRYFFNQQDFLEVHSPSLVDCPGTEPFLDVFSTQLKLGSKTIKKYLPTSPEIHLKKMLVQGFDKIFEIRPCFRNNEHSPTHRHEFYMLEWYRAYDHIETIKDDVKKLVQYLIQKNNLKMDHFYETTMSELFLKYFNFQLTPKTNYNELKELAQSNQIAIHATDTWDDLFYRLYIERIEPNLGQDPIFITKYPPSQAALARLTPDGWGDRFEFFWKGYEIANAFHELNDPQIQRQRSQDDLQYKAKIGKEQVSLDEDFFRALEFGLPPSGGIALGLERLFMALNNLQDIGELKVEFEADKNF